MKKKNLIILSVTALFFAGAICANYSLYKSDVNSFFAKISRRPVDTIVEKKKEVVYEESATISLVEEASPSVVSILKRQVLFDFFSGQEMVDESGIGTGFVIDSNGIIITNKHVVSGEAASYSVLTNDEQTYQVEEINLDPVNDIAILKINAENLPALELGDSDNLKVGQTVVAIGNALGRFSNTVTKGVVSGIGRGITASGGSGRGSEMLENIIQTDAAINPGNSGGPLLNLSAQVVGVNVAMAKGAENIGFSIPINLVKPVLQNFKEHGRIVRPYLGVKYRPAYKKADDSKLRFVYFIEQVVKDSPAEKAGLKPGDAILEINGRASSNKVDLGAEVAKMQVGDLLTLRVDRAGKEVTIEARLAESK